MSLDLTGDTPTLVLDTAEKCSNCQRPSKLESSVSFAELIAFSTFRSGRLSSAPEWAVIAVRQVQDGGSRNGLLLPVSRERVHLPLEAVKES